MQDIKDSLERYVKHKISPGGFLRAVLENDLTNAVARADYINIQRIPEIVRYVYNEVPGTAWGSPELVEEWLS